MNDEVHDFIARLLGTVILAALPVVFTAFVSVPLSLNRHPGDAVPVDGPPRHMT